MKPGRHLRCYMDSNYDIDHILYGVWPAETDRQLYTDHYETLIQRKRMLKFNFLQTATPLRQYIYERSSDVTR